MCYRVVVILVNARQVALNRYNQLLYDRNAKNCSSPNGHLRQPSNREPIPIDSFVKLANFTASKSILTY